MTFVTFINDATREPVAINPATVSMVGPVKRADVVAPACLLTIADGRTPVYVAGTFAEVVAALESAAPPVAAAVEVAPTDLERAARVLEAVALAMAQRAPAVKSQRIITVADFAFVVDTSRSPDARAITDNLDALAARLRGGG